MNPVAIIVIAALASGILILLLAMVLRPNSLAKERKNFGKPVATYIGVAAKVGVAFFLVALGWGLINEWLAFVEEQRLIADAKKNVEKYVIDLLKDHGDPFLLRYYGRYKYEEMEISGDSARKKACGLVTMWLIPDTVMVQRAPFVYLSGSHSAILVKKDPMILDLSYSSDKRYYEALQGCAVLGYFTIMR